jgi:hypothetical protein
MAPFGMMLLFCLASLKSFQLDMMDHSLVWLFETVLEAG